MQAGTLSLFADEQLLSIEKPGSTVSFIPRAKPFICKLNFSDESSTLMQRRSVPVEINKVSEITKFTPPTTHKRFKDVPSLKVSQYKSSPMQMFNSFSANSPSILSQCNKTGTVYRTLKLAEGKTQHKKVCCNCKKSHCLKLYCQCFINKSYCQDCHCVNCFNTKENETLRSKAMQVTLQRNPLAFDPKISKVEQTVSLTKHVGEEGGGQHKPTTYTRLPLQGL
jgi:hypothetical protein